MFKASIQSARARGLIIINLWRCYLTPLAIPHRHTSCVFHEWSDKDSKEQDIGLVNSPQVYIYTQYLFIYFCVKLYVLLFLIVQPMHLSICYCLRGHCFVQNMAVLKGDTYTPFGHCMCCFGYDQHGVNLFFAA